MKTLKTFSLILMLIIPVLMASAQRSASIDKITTAYIGLKNALATGNGSISENKARILFEILSADPAKGLSAGQQKLFNSYADKLKYDSRHISESTGIEHQREHFASLSKNLFEVLKGLKMNTATIYEEYCPMKKAYWLSESSSIKNPYYNDKMMATCGKVTATLPPAK